MNSGILFAFGATACWAFTAFLFTKAGRIMSAQSMNLFRLMLGVFLVWLAAVLFDTSFSNIFSDDYFQAWLWLGLSGIVALGIGDYFGLRMYTILSPRYGSVLTTLAPAVTLLLGFLLLDEHINTIGILGILITLAGVMTISFSRKEREKIPDHGHGTIYKGIVYGVVSAVCNGGALVLSKKGFIEQSLSGTDIHPVSASFMRFAAASIVALGFMFVQGILLKNLKNIGSQPAHILRIASLGVMLGPLLAVTFAMFAIQSIDVAVAQTIFSLVPAAALMISYFVLKEKITRNSLLGVTVAVAGVCVLIWSEEIGRLIG